MYCINAKSAENVKKIAIPNRIIVSDPTPLRRVANRINPQVKSAKTNALIVTSNGPTPGTTLKPSTIAKDAPKLAAADTPSVNGSAKGLFRIVCICAPATANNAPTSTAVMATGNR